MNFQNERKAKIKELKNQVKLQQLEISDMLANLDVKAEAALPEEERKERKEQFGKDFAEKRATVSSLEDELKKVRMNKYSSSTFEFIPHVGMNRQQARRFRKQKRI